MPAQRPTASFDPFPPNLDLNTLVESIPNFEYVVRISCDMIERQGLEAFEKLVLLHVILGGKPMVIEGFQYQLDQWTFTAKWLGENHGKKYEKARNLTNQEDLPLSIGHYLKNLPLLTNQWTPLNYRDPDRQRIYLKDIDCPEVWHDKLKEQIPPGLFYLNDCTGDIGGPGSMDLPAASGHGKIRGRGVARAGDLMSSLPPSMRAENMMCYIGHEGTYTPAHREMCASLGHNIMVEASGTVDADGFPEKPGSSIWFMTETKDRHLVSEYWLDKLGHDIEVEKHFAQINAWRAAPWTTYIVEQKVGDFILIPPLAPHQVWNRGTRTMKAAWNRTTVETLEMAMNEALPRAKMVCRDEQYKNKAMIYYTLLKYSELLRQVEYQKENAANASVAYELESNKKILQLKKDFRRLFTLYSGILISEMFSPDLAHEKNVQFLPFDSNVTCAYCRCNIFNRFLTCPSCVGALENGEEDAYDVCMECYAMGRSCACLAKLKWIEQFPWKDLVEKHDDWRHQIIDIEGGINDKSPQPLSEEKNRFEKKTLAQICQEQLKLRPWRDITKPMPVPSLDSEDEDVQLNDDGSVKKRRKRRRSEKWLKDNVNCHVCKHRDEKWKLAKCKCGAHYCYGSLFRGFDLMPQQVMENPNWKCPKCLKICSCGACRRDPQQKSFEPHGTLLGHDTKNVADARSVESLVDFGHSNRNWLKDVEGELPDESRRLRRRREEAEHAKSKDPVLDAHYVDDDESPNQDSYKGDNDISQNKGVAIDPQLNFGEVAMPSQSSYTIDNASIDPSLTNCNSEEQRKHDSYQHPRNSQLPTASSLLNDSLLQPCYSQGYFNGEGPHSLHDQNGYEQPPSHLVAPAAMMVVQDDEYQHLNGPDPDAITFHYPDPSMPEQEGMPSSQNGLPQQPLHKEDDPIMCLVNQKRKRQEERILLQSDLTPKNYANRQFQQAQVQKTLAEAKKNDRFISAQAALSGKNLVVKLSIPKAKLAELKASEAYTNHRSSGLRGDGAEGVRDQHAIIRSDAPRTPTGFVSTNRPSLPHARVRLELDEDFSTRKKRTNNKEAEPSLQPSKGNPSKVKRFYAEVSDDSDDLGGVQLDGTVESREKATKKPRVSTWLSRKNKDESETPSELRPQPKKKQKTSRAGNPVSISGPVPGTFAHTEHSEPNLASWPIAEPATTTDLSRQTLTSGQVSESVAVIQLPQRSSSHVPQAEQLPALSMHVSETEVLENDWIDADDDNEAMDTVLPPPTIDKPLPAIPKAKDPIDRSLSRASMNRRTWKTSNPVSAEESKRLTQAEANRKAKLMAARWAEGDAPVSEQEWSDDDDVPNRAPLLRKKSEPSPQKPSTKDPVNGSKPAKTNGFSGALKKITFTSKKSPFDRPAARSKKGRPTSLHLAARRQTIDGVERPIFNTTPQPTSKLKHKFLSRATKSAGSVSAARASPYEPVQAQADQIDPARAQLNERIRERANQVEFVPVRHESFSSPGISEDEIPFQAPVATLQSAARNGHVNMERPRRSARRVRIPEDIDERGMQLD
ncbi:MAG: hypothetical protein M1827_005328 [Pycnora praestabilis]|nr:MAG: hypothetical protein M1827_005328 [Pycnora praestabilis]